MIQAIRRFQLKIRNFANFNHDPRNASISAENWRVRRLQRWFQQCFDFNIKSPKFVYFTIPAMLRSHKTRKFVHFNTDFGSTSSSIFFENFVNFNTNPDNDPIIFQHISMAKYSSSPSSPENPPRQHRRSPPARSEDLGTPGYLWEPAPHSNSIA